MSGLRTGDRQSPFDIRVISALIIAGLIGFFGFWALSAFAPELGSGKDAQGHALSISANGFAGVLRVAQENGVKTHLIRHVEEGIPGAQDTELGGLLVLTPPPETSAEDFDERIKDVRTNMLVILPKYVTMGNPLHRGWVAQGAELGERTIPAISHDDARVSTQIVTNAPRSMTTELWEADRFTMPLPRHLQVISGDAVKPILAVDGGTILGEVKRGRTSFYVLSDPDLLNNIAFADAPHATAAVQLLRAIAGPGEPVGFDVVLNGLGSGARSLLRLAFTPPFLGLTLCLMVACLLALWQGFVRFGPPWSEARRIALGKAGLVSNGAQLIVQARRVPHFGARYGSMVRDAAMRRLHAPAGLTGAALDRWLDRFTDSKGRRFSALLADLESAGSTEDCVRSAGALGQWRKDVLRDSD